MNAYGQLFLLHLFEHECANILVLNVVLALLSHLCSAIESSASSIYYLFILSRLNLLKITSMTRITIELKNITSIQYFNRVDSFYV